MSVFIIYYFGSSILYQPVKKNVKSNTSSSNSLSINNDNNNNDVVRKNENSNITSRNYCAMFAHKRLRTNLCNLGFISINIDAGTNSTCSRDSHMVEDCHHIIFGLIGST